MSTGVLVPLDEYLACPYDPDREYFGGLLVERNAGEYDHSLNSGCACAIAWGS
jgi:hypothetical protein